MVRLAAVSDESCPPAEPTPEQRMWAYYVIERAKSRTPTGSELDRMAGTNNYGRQVLRQWKSQGHVRTEDASEVGPTKVRLTAC
jgi:hypothetical protein